MYSLAFADIWDVQVRPFCVKRSRLFLTALGVLSFVYSAFRIPVKTEDALSPAPNYDYCTTLFKNHV